MTRKRFVKLLMAYGYSRNSAQAIAKDCNRWNIPYKRAMRVYTSYPFVRRVAINIASLGSFAFAEKKRGDAEK